MNQPDFFKSKAALAINKITECKEALLVLDRYELDDELINVIFPYLEKQNKVTSLRLRCNSLGDGAVKKLIELKLETLDLTDNNVSDASAELLAQSKIKNLILTSNNFTNKGAQIFIDSSKQDTLDLSKNSISEELLMEIERNMLKKQLLMS
jgi:hypothetical protein